MYNAEFYKNLVKPSITPKPCIFQIVWPILYILMLISITVVVKTGSHTKLYAIIAFIIQLILNLFWSPIFFIWKKIKIAFIISIALILSVIWMIMEFFKISKIASIIQIPYLIWLIFAAILNYFFVKLNSRN